MSAHSDGPHIIPLRVYLGIGGTLLFLTWFTVWIAGIDLGVLNLPVAMAVATFKASLVAMIFMHLKYDNKLYLTVFLASLFFLGVFIVITMFDTMRRADIYKEVGESIRPKAALYENIKVDSTATEKH